VLIYFIFCFVFPHFRRRRHFDVEAYFFESDSELNFMKVNQVGPTFSLLEKTFCNANQKKAYFSKSEFGISSSLCLHMLFPLKNGGWFYHYAYHFKVETRVLCLLRVFDPCVEKKPFFSVECVDQVPCF
jgi:hypothetical protein